MDNGACGLCRSEGPLYVAPGGAMVCEQRLHLGHIINLSRLQGLAEEDQRGLANNGSRCIRRCQGPC